MKTALLMFNDGTTLVGRVVADDKTSVLCYIKDTSILVWSHHRTKGGTWLIGRTSFIGLDKKSKANRDLLKFLGEHK
jgi:hypothetical protein